MVETDILEPKYNKHFTRISSVLIWLLYLVVLLFENNSVGQKIAFCVTIVIIILYFYLPYIIAYHNRVGIITFTENEVFIAINNNRKSYKINNVDKIRISYYGYKGRIMINPIVNDNGEYNYFTVWNDNMKEKYQFFISEYNHLRLKKIVRTWRERYENVEIISSS